MGRFVEDCTQSPVPALGALSYGRETAVPDPAAPAPGRRDKARYVRLEIRTDALLGLLYSRSLVIEDLRGLDVQSQRCIKQLLLDTLRLLQLKEDSAAIVKTGVSTVGGS